MPICKNCEKHYPWKIVIDGKLRLLAHRKYCLDCSPFGKHNTVVINALPKGQKIGVCNRCRRTFDYNKSKGHQRYVCNSCLTTSRKQYMKQKCVDYKGGKCCKCAYSKCLDNLSFHHLDPKTKEFAIAANYNRKWEDIKKELDKCILVCMNCHGEIHAGILGV